jgi:hypothetical protein
MIPRFPIVNPLFEYTALAAVDLPGILDSEADAFGSTHDDPAHDEEEDPA